MAFDYSKIQTVVDDINSNYVGWKAEPVNHRRFDLISSQNTVETEMSPMYESIITYLYNNHSSKTFLEFFMGIGLLKFHNNDSGSNLSISSACWKREKHSVDLSDSSEINAKGDDFRGLMNIKIKAALGVQADYKLNMDQNNSSSLNISTWDDTQVNLNDFDMLLIESPPADLFNDINAFKTAISFTGSILLYNVGIIYNTTLDLTGYIDNNENSTTYGQNLEQLLGDPESSNVSSLPSHTELDFSGTRGFYIP